MGHDEEVRMLMSNGAPFTTDWLGTSPLHMAARCGHATTAEVLLRAGVSRDARTKVDRTPLHMAAQEGHNNLALLLLSHGADINAKDMLKMTPLQWATERQHKEVVETLVRNDADVSCFNKFDKTALEIAAENGNQEIVEILVNAQNSSVNGDRSTTRVLIEPATRVRVSSGASTSAINVSAASMTSMTSTSAISTMQNFMTAAAKAETSQRKSKYGKNDVFTFGGHTIEAAPGSSTSVLAQLAALAEASAPLRSPTTVNQEAISWLEASGMDTGQTFTLTDAGKLALNWDTGKSSKSTSSGTTSNTNYQVEVVPGEDQKVITIVTDNAVQEEITEDNLTSMEEVSSEQTSTTISSAPTSQYSKITVTTTPGMGEDGDAPATVTLIANEVEVEN